MAAPMIVLGVLGYLAAGLILLVAPTITQQIVAMLVATNATLFFVGGVIISAVAPVEPKAASQPKAPPRDEYAEWADNVLKSKA